MRDIRESNAVQFVDVDAENMLESAVTGEPIEEHTFL
jgi:hypothetical protein